MENGWMEIYLDHRYILTSDPCSDAIDSLSLSPFPNYNPILLLSLHFSFLNCLIHKNWYRKYQAKGQELTPFKTTTGLYLQSHFVSHHDSSSLTMGGSTERVSSRWGRKKKKIERWIWEVRKKKGGTGLNNFSSVICSSSSR